MKLTVLALLVIFVAAGIVHATIEEVKGVVKLYCSDDQDGVSKVEDCLKMLSEKSQDAMKACKEETVPKVGETWDFRKGVCEDDEKKTKFIACLESRRTEIEDIPEEDKAAADKCLQSLV